MCSKSGLYLFNVSTFKLRIHSDLISGIDINVSNVVFETATEILTHVEAEFQCERNQTRGTRIKLSDKVLFHTIQRFRPTISMKSGRSDSNYYVLC